MGLESDGGAVIARSQLYGGKIIATTRADAPAIFAVVAGSFPESAGKAGGKGQQVKIDPPAALSSLHTRFISASAPSGEGVDITKAERLVSVGRGIGGPENLELAEELARPWAPRLEPHAPSATAAGCPSHARSASPA